MAARRATIRYPTLSELLKKGANEVSRGGRRHVLCDGAGGHWIVAHDFKRNEKGQIRRDGDCYCNGKVDP